MDLILRLRVHYRSLRARTGLVQRVWALDVGLHHGLEAQAEFRSERGTIDGLFAAFVWLKKRQEHGMETCRHCSSISSRPSTQFLAKNSVQCFAASGWPTTS